MSRITHFKVQPKNIQYWDYYILCHLDTYAAIALQRFEYWDGTKSDGNIHAEDINDILESIEEEATQDISRFFYKAQDELQWELMSLTGEKYTANIINLLIKDLNYLEQRNNPSNAMDRKKQYLFHDELVQDHVNYLGYIIDYFKRLGFQLSPIYYAVEKLTEAKMHIDTLNVASVIEKLAEMHIQMEEDEAKVKESKKYKPILPKFIRIQLNRDKGLLPLLKVNKLRRFRNFAEWKAQFCGIDSAETRDANGNNADCTPQECGSNSNNYKQQLQTERENEGAPTSTNPQRDDSSLPSSTPSLSSSVEHLSATNVHNPTQDVENKQAVIQVDESPIATTTTPSSPPSHRNTDKLDPLGIYDEAEKQQHHWWRQLGLAVKVNLTNKEHWKTLSEFVHSFEDMKSLYDYTAKELEKSGKPDQTVKPGNLANADNLNGWKKAQRQIEAQKAITADPSKLPSISGLRNYVSEPEVLPAIQNPPGEMKKLPDFKLRRMTPANKVVQ